MDDECIHGLTVRTCDFCLGALSKRPYRDHIDKIAPGFIEKPKVMGSHYCEKCASRAPVRGNRVFVRIPRPPKHAFGKGRPLYGPSWQGPLMQMPKIHKATHRDAAGRWVCDICDGRHRVPVQAGIAKPKASPESRIKPLSSGDIWAA